MSGECIEWLSWLESVENIDIQHAKNGPEYQAGKKKRAVDGYCKLVSFLSMQSAFDISMGIGIVIIINFRARNTIYQYHGCFFHGCSNCITEDRDTEKGGWSSPNQKLLRTQETTEYLESEGYTVIEMWGCQWKAMRKQVQLSEKYNLPHEECYRMTSNQILDAVSQGTMFGAIEVFF